MSLFYKVLEMRKCKSFFVQSVEVIGKLLSKIYWNIKGVFQLGWKSLSQNFIHIVMSSIFNISIHIFRHVQIKRPWTIYRSYLGNCWKKNSLIKSQWRILQISFISPTESVNPISNYKEFKPKWKNCIELNFNLLAV